MESTTIRVPVEQARRAIIAAQGLGRSGAGASGLSETLERTGFVRTLGGVEAYLALRARVPELSAEQIHAALSAGAAQVVPAVRGCIYLVSRSHVPTAMRIAEVLSKGRMERERDKVGISSDELATLGQQVLEVLRAGGPMTTDAIRRALPQGSVRSLGDAGKKLGMSSTLPSALRDLEFAGKIERTLDGGRLDSERYLWRALEGAAPATDATDDVSTLAKIAEVFLRAAGLGTVKDFAEWAGVPQRDAAAAIDQLDTIRVEIEGESEPRVALAELRESLGAGASSADSAVALLPFEDNLLALQGGPAMLIDRAHHGIEVPQWGSGDRRVAIRDAKHVGLRSIVADGKVAGFWEFDPRSKQVVYALFDVVSPEAHARVVAEADRVGRFLAEEVGHGRSFSLDTDEALAERADWIRALASGETPRAERPKKRPAKKVARKPLKKAKAKTKMATAKKKTKTGLEAAVSRLKKAAKPVRKAVKKAVNKARKAVRKGAKKVARKTR